MNEHLDESFERPFDPIIDDVLVRELGALGLVYANTAELPVDKLHDDRKWVDIDYNPCVEKGRE